ncbi:MAG: TRAP transporter substrate-binding protein [Gammaproteobacteria bacterium]|nr:TRAP transporter substrate-binding protein [Gammaproteobacteria bacterium]MDE0246691.1 TRAP transporter substrate-binding protein [Gammaproteobacteria bacterium]
MLRLLPLGMAAVIPVLLVALSACSPVSQGDSNEGGSKSLILAHPLPPLAPPRTGVIVPFSQRLAEVSGGRLTAAEYMGGALGNDARRYYPMLLEGVADIALVVPGYTATTFPRTALSTFPGVCDSPVDCTVALQRGLTVLEDDYNARILAMWSPGPPVLLTRDRPVRRVEDIRGLKLRVPSAIEMPFLEALGATPLQQPVTEVYQSLQTGVIDGIVIPAGGIPAFRLNEVASFLTTWMPLSATPVTLLMNQGAYELLTPRERRWVDEASGAWLSGSGGQAFELATARGLGFARESGIEIIDLPDSERARFLGAVAEVYEAELSRRIGDATVAEVLAELVGN